MKIYVITQGCYSDYHIIAATTDEEKAKMIAAKFDEVGDETNIEVYDDADNVVYERPAWVVRFSSSGEVRDICPADYDFQYQRVIEGAIHKVISDNILVYVSADTKEAAIKIASEKRAMWLAQKEGLC